MDRGSCVAMRILPVILYAQRSLLVYMYLCSSCMIPITSAVGLHSWSQQLSQLSSPQLSLQHHTPRSSQLLHRQQHSRTRGDLILGCLFPMHYGNLFANGTADRCSRVNPFEGIQAFEATLFTLEKLRLTRFLGNITLGVLAMDTCQDVDFALSQSLNFTNVLIRSFISQKMIQCSDGSQPSISGSLTELMKIIGVLGAAESDVSVAIASFMKHFRIPQVSYMSTTPVLSSKDKFPFFLRTVPSDANTVQGIVDLLRSQNWTYVNVVYDDTNYGTMAFNAFETLINDRTAEGNASKICISTKMKIDSSDWDAGDYEQEIHDNLLADSNANSCVQLLRPEIRES